MLKAHEAGLNVMPLKARDKRPLLDSWRSLMWDPAGPELVAGWGDLWPDCNYAVITGMACGFVVIDADDDKAAYQVEGWAPWVFTVRTSRGVHFYAKHPFAGEIGNRAGVLPGIDLRGDGGYVVGPGSIHPSGKVYEALSLYEWKEGLRLSPTFNPSWFPPVSKVDKSHAPAPVLEDRQLTPSEFGAMISKLGATTQAFLLGQFKDGPQWNNRMHNAASDMAGNGWPYQEALPLLLSGAVPSSPDDYKQACSTIWSAFRTNKLPASEYTRRKKGAA